MEKTDFDIEKVKFKINFNILSKSFEFLKKICPIFGKEYENIFYENAELNVDKTKIKELLEVIIAYNYDIERKELNPEIVLLFNIISEVTGINIETLKALDLEYISEIILRAFSKIGGKDPKNFFAYGRYDLSRYDKRIKLYRHRPEKEEHDFLYNYRFDFWSIHWWRDFVIAPLRKDGFSYKELCEMDINIIFFELEGLKGRNELEESVHWFATEEKDPAGINDTKLLGPDGQPLQIKPVNQRGQIEMRLEDIEEEERIKEELKNAERK